MSIFDWLRPRSSSLALADADTQRRIVLSDARKMEMQTFQQAYSMARVMSGADANAQWQTPPIGNPSTGLLGQQDWLVGTVPQPYFFLTDYSLAQLYADPITRRATSEIPASIAAAGHIVTTPEGDDYMADCDAEYSVSMNVGEALRRANHLRAAGLLIDVEEDGDPPLSEPMDPAKVRRIRGLTPFGGLSLQVTSWQGLGERLPPFWRRFQKLGQPEMFQLNATFRTGAYNGPIHWTRVLYFPGVTIPPDVDGMLACPSSHYCLSVCDLIWAAIRRYSTTTTNAERIAMTQGAWLFNVPNKGALDSAQQMNPGVMGSWVSTMLSYFYGRRAMVGGPGFEASAVTVNLAGWEQMEMGAYVQVSAACRTPVQKLFITTPAGMSSTPSDQWKPQYHDVLRADFDERVEPNLVKFYTLEYYLRRRMVPRRLTVRPGPWEEPSEQQRIEIRKSGADELKTLIDSGVLTPDEARARYYKTFTIDFPVKRPEVAPGLADAAADVLVALEVERASVDVLRASVGRLVPGLVLEDWAHVTLVYLGTLPDRELVAVRAKVEGMADGWPAEVEPDCIGVLGDDGALVLHLRARDLRGRQDRMQRTMARQIRAEQFPRYLPHVTLGYLGRALTDEEQARLDALVLPTVRVSRLVLRSGGAEVAGWAV
mgnify:CR=1 FL=1